MTTKLPVEHIRRSSLPWWTADLTECGRLTVDMAVTIDRTAFEEKVKDQGVQRAMLTTCMTCAQTAERWPTWDADPTGRMGREFYGRTREAMGSELRAIAALIMEHSDEYAELFAGIDDVVSLSPKLAQAQWRRW